MPSCLCPCLHAALLEGHAMPVSTAAPSTALVVSTVCAGGWVTCLLRWKAKASLQCQQTLQPWGWGPQQQRHWRQRQQTRQRRARQQRRGRMPAWPQQRRGRRATPASRRSSGSRCASGLWQCIAVCLLQLIAGLAVAAQVAASLCLACCLTLQCLSLSAVQSLRHYQRAGALDPGCKLALSNQAAALLQLKRWEEAADAASQARCALAGPKLAIGRLMLHLDHADGYGAGLSCMPFFTLSQSEHHPCFMAACRRWPSILAS